MHNIEPSKIVKDEPFYWTWLVTYACSCNFKHWEIFVLNADRTPQVEGELKVLSPLIICNDSSRDSKRNVVGRSRNSHQAILRSATKPVRVTGGKFYETPKL